MIQLNDEEIEVLSQKIQKMRDSLTEFGCQGVLIAITYRRKNEDAAGGVCKNWCSDGGPFLALGLLEVVKKELLEECQ